MVRAVLFLIILQFICHLAYSRSYHGDYSLEYNEIESYSTEGLPITTQKLHVNQPINRNQSYCKGWCRDWIHSGRRYQYKKHIACNNNEEFSSGCLYPAMLEMFPDRIDHILSKHNSIRNLIALGQMKPKFEEATRMPLIKWDNELARLASLNVKKCKFEVDFCFDKENFEHFGQNIAIWDTSYGPVNYTLLIDEMLRNWSRNDK